MDIQKCTKQSFSVIGKEGSTNDGENFVQGLWADANAHFNEVAGAVYDYNCPEENGQAYLFFPIGRCNYGM